MVGVKNNTTVAEFNKLLRNSLVTNFESLMDGTGKPLDANDGSFSMLPGMGEAGGFIKSISEGIKRISTAVSNVINKVLTAAKGIVSKVTSFVSKVMSAVKNVIKQVASYIGKVLQVPLQFIGNIVKTIGSYVKKLVGMVGGVLKDKLGLGNFTSLGSGFKDMAYKLLGMGVVAGTLFGYKADKHQLGGMLDRFISDPDVGRDMTIQGLRFGLNRNKKADPWYMDALYRLIGSDPVASRLYRSKSIGRRSARTMSYGSKGSVWTAFDSRGLSRHNASDMLALASNPAIENKLRRSGQMINRNMTLEEYNDQIANRGNELTDDTRLNIYHKYLNSHRDVAFPTTPEGAMEAYLYKKQMRLILDKKPVARSGNGTSFQWDERLYNFFYGRNGKLRNKNKLNTTLHLDKEPTTPKVPPTKVTYGEFEGFTHESSVEQVERKRPASKYKKTYLSY